MKIPKQLQTAADDHHTSNVFAAVGVVNGIVKMLPFASYFVYAYVLLPLAIRGTTTFLQSKLFYQVCPVLHCAPDLVRCFRDAKCKEWLDDVQQCEDPSSEARRISAEVFSHVQFASDVAFCRYQSFDRLESTAGVDFLECMGRSGCLEPSSYSDQCAHIDPTTRKGLSFGPALSPILQGRWKKLYTTGWDTWPVCIFVCLGA